MPWPICIRRQNKPKRTSTKVQENQILLRKRFGGGQGFGTGFAVNQFVTEKSFHGIVFDFFNIHHDNDKNYYTTDHNGTVTKEKE